MYNNIVRETSSEIRALARRALKGKWGQVFVAMLIFYILVNTVPQLLDSFFSFGKSYSSADIAEILENGDFDQLRVSVDTGISSLYSLALTGAFSVGICSYMLAFFRKGETDPGHIFDGFEYYLKTLALMLLKGLFIFLWSLLFVIPGIVAAYRYSQAFYILADNPSKGVMQCLQESKLIMTGNKWKLFSLTLSFIGWYILVGVCSYAIGSGLAMITSIISFKAFIVLMGLVSSLPGIILVVYLQTALAAFYELASGHLIARPSQINAVDVDSEAY